MILLLSGILSAAPLEAGQDPHQLWVRLAPEVSPVWLQKMGAVPSFSQRGPRLDRYYRFRAGDTARIEARLREDPRVDRLWFANLPIPPPDDIPPVTEDFRPLQTWLDASGGFSFVEGALWPGGRGEGVTVADVEYAWHPEHEDLGATLGIQTWGVAYTDYFFHGNSVLGMLFGGVNGYGVDGAVPEATPMVLHPIDEDDSYDVAGAVAAAVTLLVPGDVLLVEQQGYAHGNYCPTSADPAVFDAIAAAVDAGIVVVEPGGNGGQDLDSERWQGAFDRSIADSGSILVGGGAGPDSGMEPRSWYPYGSSHGSRLDVQGWYSGIVTATAGDYDGAYADLAWYNEDDRQAYTDSFGGTSGASPMVAAAAAVLQSVTLAQGQPPWEPRELRAALVASGTPQAAGDTALIGPQPDVRRLLRTWAR